MTKTAIHNIAPPPSRGKLDDDVSIACRQIAQAIRNAVAPSLEQISNMITNEHQRCQGLRTNGARPGPRAPLALPTDLIALAPKGDDAATVTNQANVVRRGEFEGVRLANGTLVLKSED